MIWESVVVLVEVNLSIHVMVMLLLSETIKIERETIKAVSRVSLSKGVVEACKGSIPQRASRQTHSPFIFILYI